MELMGVSHEPDFTRLPGHVLMKRKGEVGQVRDHIGVPQCPAFSQVLLICDGHGSFGPTEGTLLENEQLVIFSKVNQLESDIGAPEATHPEANFGRVQSQQRCGLLSCTEQGRSRNGGGNNPFGDEEKQSIQGTEAQH